MKNIITFFLTFIASCALLAQTNAAQRPAQAEFKYNKESLQKAIGNNTVVFVFSNLPDGAALENFKKKADVYKEFYTVTTGKQQPNGERECTINFKKDDVNLRILSRLFLSIGINELTFDGQRIRSEDFFSGY